MSQFNNLLGQGNIKGAAELACGSPGDMLRNADTINRIKGMQQTPGQAPPLLQYFSVLLEKGKLNKLESLELARPVVQQGLLAAAGAAWSGGAAGAVRIVGEARAVCVQRSHEPPPRRACSASPRGLQAARSCWRSG